jgi:protein-S-isoprenylcysteine O-methyltransferase Ste14
MSSEGIALDSPVRKERTSRKKVTTVEIIGFAVVVVLWVTFAGALFFSQSSIHDMWAWFKDQSLVLQVPLGILFLPWLIGVWIWESSWPVAARGVLVGGLAWANLYAFSPWKPLA